MNRKKLRLACRRDRRIYVSALGKTRARTLRFTLDFDDGAWSKLPASPNKPNALTEETMRRTNAGEDLSGPVESIEELMKLLNS
jgi:hypothetical protein